MQPDQNRSSFMKKVILGICGSIAAYKTPDLVRKLIEAGYQVKIVMTKAASAFVTPLSLQAVSMGEVYEELLDPTSDMAMDHIELARWADIILIAPATAHLLSQLANGLASDLLTTLCLASKATLFIAPAMNKLMWDHLAIQSNVQLLKNRGALFLGPARGEQACGDYGFGRFLEPIEIIETINSLFCNPTLVGKNILITAGPTQEAIDPVRYISNRSSGKMGYALAEAAALAGAQVTLITGPTSQPQPTCEKIIVVTTAAEMFAAVKEHISKQDIFIAAAAVADYTVTQIANKKIKSNEESFTLILQPTIDILAYVAKLHPKPLTVGFAAETDSLEEHARAKLNKKNADLIIANDVSCHDIGFDSDDNAVSIFSSQPTIHLAKASKREIASEIIKIIAAKVAKNFM